MRDDAKKRLHHGVEVATFYSLALRHTKHLIGNRRVGAISLRQIVDLLQLKGAHQLPVSSPWGYARSLQQVLGNFLNSASSQFNAAHLPFSLRQHKEADTFLEDSAQLFNMIRPGADTTLNTPHDVYFKEWVLRGAPGLSEHPFVLLDEAQDSSGVMLSALSFAQRVVMVGDLNQQLYAFKGAMGLLEKVPGPTLPLSTSFRFGPELAAFANAILAKKKSKNRLNLRALASKRTNIGPLPRGIAHTRLYRTGYELVKDALSLADSSIKFATIGNMSDLTDKLSSAEALRAGRMREVVHPQFACFASWGAALEALHDREDPEIRQAVTLVEEFAGRVDELVSLLVNAKPDARTQVLLSTAHQAKGLEFKNVLISRDFDVAFDRVAGKRCPIQEHDVEHNLLYVGATRAMENLEIQSEYGRSIAEAL